MAQAYLIPAIVMGLAIGLVELFFVHADERGLGWLSHGLHTLPAAFIFTFIAMNLGYAAELVNITLTLEDNFWLTLGIRVLIGLIAAIKVKAAAAIVTGRNAVGEKLWHALVVGALIAASPYLWEFVAPFAPEWMTIVSGAE